MLLLFLFSGRSRDVDGVECRRARSFLNGESVDGADIDGVGDGLVIVVACKGEGGARGHHQGSEGDDGEEDSCEGRKDLHFFCIFLYHVFVIFLFIVENRRRKRKR